MKKNRAHLNIITCLAFAILLSGCTGKADKNNYSNNTTAASGSTQKKSSNNVDQGVYVVFSDEDDWEFYIIKGKDELYDVTDGVMAYSYMPELDYGHGAFIHADISTGGMSTGGWDSLYFQKYESMEPMGIDEVADKLNIPEMQDLAEFPGAIFTKYTDGEDIYYLLFRDYNFEVFKNKKPYLYIKCLFYNYSSPLQKAVALGYSGPQSRIDSDFTEDEILNMSEEDFWFYGVFKDHLKDKTLSVAELPEDASFEEGKYAAAHPEDLCIGEFLVEVEDGSVLRRYYLGNAPIYGQWETDVFLGLDEWHISEDGTVEYTGAQENMRGSRAQYCLVQ